MELCPKCKKHAAVLDRDRSELVCKQYGCLARTPVIGADLKMGMSSLLIDALTPEAWDRLVGR